MAHNAPSLPARNGLGAALHPCQRRQDLFQDLFLALDLPLITGKGLYKPTA